MLSLIQHLIYYPILNLISFIIWLVPGHNAFWGIIGVTLLVRLILIVPFRHSSEVQRKMNELRPMMDQLKVDYAGDQKGLAEAQMELYRKNQISPFAGCLPMVAQIVMLFSLYAAVRNGLHVDGPHLYSWLPRPDVINTHLFGINLAARDTTYILPILASGFQYFQTKMMMPPVPKDQALTADDGILDPTAMISRYGIYIFPILTFSAAVNPRIPSGVVLYWAVSTAFSVVQQYYVNKENLRLKGVKEELAKAEKMHPENFPQIAKKSEEKEVISKEHKQGVTVTVRRKK